MKKLNVVLVTIVCVLFVSVNSFAAGIRTEFKDYEIEKVNTNMGKNVSDVWKLSYGNDQKAVMVVKRMSQRGAEYIVSSKYFEVSYANSESGFGVKQVRKAWSKVPAQINHAVLNPSQMSNQRIITPATVNDEEALGLIANYLPALINDNYTHVLN